MKKLTAHASDTIPENVFKLVSEVGVPSHLKGYNYSAYAVKLVAEKPSLVDSVTKELYPEIAKAFNTTSSRVERAIRHAIDYLFLEVDLEVIYRYFGNSIPSSKGKPTNSQFIATLGRIARQSMMNSKKTK